MRVEHNLIETKEKRQHSSTFLPYSTYECRIPEYFVNVPMHWHSEFELNLVREGSAEFIINDEKYIVSPGDLLILPPDILHAVYPLENQPLFYDAFVFNKLMLGAGSNDRSVSECIQPIITGNHKVTTLIPGNNPHHHDLYQCADTIFMCAKKNQAHYDLLLKSELLRFFYLLENAGDFIQRTPIISSYSAIIRPTLEYMNEHFAEDLSIQELADRIHLSKSYYMYCFKKAVGIGAIEYLSQLRMQAAQDYLIASDLSIANICEKCGYGNLSNFNRQFKKLVGCTPNEYRKKYN